MANISYDHPTSSRAHPLPLKRSRRRESRSSIALSTPRWENISPSTLDHPPTRALAPPRPITRRSRKPNEHPPTRAPHRTTARTALAPAPRSPGRQRANAGVERNPETTSLDARVGTRLSESARRRTFSPETRWVVHERHASTPLLHRAWMSTCGRTVHTAATIDDGCSTVDRSVLDVSRDVVHRGGDDFSPSRARSIPAARSIRGRDG